MSEWFENEDFWTEMYPYMFPEERFESAPEEIDKILSLVEFSGTHILDLCCGPGRHATILAERGFSVTGVDATAFLLQKARARASEQKLDVEFVQEDMRHFVRSASYDLVLNMFTSFGYFDDKDEDLRVLSNIYESLRPGGILVMELMSKERLASVFAATSSEVHPDGTLIVQRREIFDDWTRIRNEWLLIRDEQVKSFKFHHTLYSGQELKDRLLRVGFSTTQLYGDLAGSAYGRSSKRLVALARKEAS